MASTNFSVRMDSEIKKQCETLYGELGMNLTTAINVFRRLVDSHQMVQTYQGSPY